MPTFATANALCTAAELAEVLGITDRRVRQLTKAGALKCARTKLNGMHFRLADSVQRFVKYECDLVTEQCAVGNGEYERARTRRALAAAQLLELQVRAQEGTMYYAVDVEHAITTQVTACKQRLLAIPARVARRLVGCKTFKEAFDVVSEEIHSALHELTGYDANYFRKSTEEHIASLGVEEQPGTNGEAA